jgi:hypothetical protein
MKAARAPPDLSPSAHLLGVERDRSVCREGERKRVRGCGSAVHVADEASPLARFKVLIEKRGGL